MSIKLYFYRFLRGAHLLFNGATPILAAITIGANPSYFQGSTLYDYGQLILLMFWVVFYTLLDQVYYPVTANDAWRYSGITLVNFFIFLWLSEGDWLYAFYSSFLASLAGVILTMILLAFYAALSPKADYEAIDLYKKIPWWGLFVLFIVALIGGFYIYQMGIPFLEKLSTIKSRWGQGVMAVSFLMDVAGVTHYWFTTAQCKEPSSPFALVTDKEQEHWAVPAFFVMLLAIIGFLIAVFGANS